jgi:apolipoprotein D and lipocalin family protein
LVDKAAHNAVEHYYLNAENEVETTYRFRDGSFTGELKTFTPTGFPRADDPSNARWKMQFIWPFKADYVILHVDEDYQTTIIGHPNRKYAWIMDRSTEIDEGVYEEMMAKLEKAGFDRSVIQPLPHDWSNETDRLRNLEKTGAKRPLEER